MLNTYFASVPSILFVILAQPDICLCSGECFFLQQCLENKGADFTGLTISFNTRYSARQSWGAFCRNVDNLVDCYKPLIAASCPSVALIIPYVPSQALLKKTYQKTCAQLDNLIELTVCFDISGVANSLGLCYTSIPLDPVKTFAIGCGGPDDVLLKCIKEAIQGKCSQKAIDFVSTPLAVLCSTGNKELAQISTLLCVYMLLRLFIH